MFDRRLLRNIALATVGLVLLGTVTFMSTADLSFGEAIYQSSFILIAHFDHYGFHDPMSRAMVMFLAVSSLVVMGYLLKVLADYIVSLGDGLRRKHMKRVAQKLADHYIVCGLGRVGVQVAEELADEGVDFICVDKNEDHVKQMIAHGHNAIVGDSTKEEVLKQAGVERARGIVAAMGDDSANLFVTLASRQLNPSIFIVARVNRNENRDRMTRAGADRTTMPYQIGGYHMATTLTRPNVVDFLEILSTNNNSELNVREFVVNEEAGLAGKKLSWLYNHKLGATVLSLNSADGLSKVNPSGGETLYAGDKLIVIGTDQQLKEMSSLI
jgi:voltage-gated potassium channel